MSPRRSEFTEVESVHDRLDATLMASVLRAQDYRRMPWKNAAGWTSEVLRVPDCEDWNWRLSIADIEADAAFSTFPGVDRWLVLLSGNGMRLKFDDGHIRTLLPPHGEARFSGEQPLIGELLEGPSRDFNLMWKRACVTAQTWRRPLVGPMVLFVDRSETWVIYLLAGQAEFNAECGLPRMQQGDTAILQGGDERTRYALEGGGEVLMIRLQQLDASCPQQQIQS